MLAHEDLEPRTEATGADHQRAEQQRGEHDLDRQRASPVAADVPNDVAGARDGEQERARHEQRRRVEDRAARHVHLDRPAGVARRRHGDERHDDRGGDRARHPDVCVETTEQHRVGEQEQVEREHAGEADRERPQPPARLRVRSTDQLLDEHQAEHCEGEAHAEHVAAREAGCVRERQRIGQQEPGTEQQGNERHGRAARRGNRCRHRRRVSAAAVEEAPDEEEPRRVARDVGGFGADPRGVETGRRYRNAEQRPDGRCDNRRKQQHRASIAPPADQRAQCERRVNDEPLRRSSMRRQY